VLELYFAQNRFYDPQTKGFTQEDPIKDGLNWYSYVSNNPLNRTDSFGLFSETTRLSFGSKGDDVVLLQQTLYFLGYDLGEMTSGGVSGIFDIATRNAVNSFKDTYIPDGNRGGDRGVVGISTLQYLIDKTLEKWYGQYFPRTICDILQVGSNGAEVVMLQRALMKLGYSVGSSGADGDFGGNTLKGVNNFKDDYVFYGNQGDFRGKVGSSTWEYLREALFNQIISSQRYGTSSMDAFIDVALSQLTITDAEKYRTYANVWGEGAWCAAFVSWCANEAGTSMAKYDDKAGWSDGDMPIFVSCIGAGKKSGIGYYAIHNRLAVVMNTSNFESSVGLNSTAKSYQKYYDPTYVPNPGDTIFFRWNATDYHVGLVYKVDGAIIYTIEGNTNSLPEESGREGYVLNASGEIVKSDIESRSIAIIKRRAKTSIFAYGKNS